MRITTRKKLVSVALATVVFAALGTVTTLAVGRPVELGAPNSALIGLGVGLFEEFYVQSASGRWLRNLHPLRALLFYAGVVIVIYFVARHLSLLLLGRLDDLPNVYRRLPFVLPLFLGFSMVGVLVMRVIHFVGAETLYHLLIGTYHRPVLERRVLMFLDMNGSTALGERLGPFAMRALVRKFFADVTDPITEHGGEVYLYKGDGLIASWPWDRALEGETILRAVDAIFGAIEEEARAYTSEFGAVPSLRIGIHGGEVVVSEQGDVKRSIGVYGDAINIAARMEEAARDMRVRCVVSETVAEALGPSARLHPLGSASIKGISRPIAVCGYG